MLEGLDEALTGMSAGETKDFTAPLAGGDRDGQDADVTVTVQSVKERVLPELDDEFAQLASEFDTMDELTEDVRAQAERAKKFEQGVQARDKVLEHLLETTEIPVPDSLVEAEVHSHLEGENRLDDDEHRAEVGESTRKALKAQFLLDAIVEKEEVQVSQDELIEYLVMSAQQYGMEPNEFAQAVDQGGQVPAMLAEVGRRKALASVLEQAEVVDSAGNVVDLNALNTEEDVEDATDDAEATEAAAMAAAQATAEETAETEEAADTQAQDAEVATDEAAPRDEQATPAGS
jgi:trigger factor